jgi:hypothetical protein
MQWSARYRRCSVPRARIGYNKTPVQWPAPVSRVKYLTSFSEFVLTRCHLGIKEWPRADAGTRIIHRPVL